ncbi:MAG: nahR1 [Polaromonas sp.]|nr:nahR1 [Polaromonas sp.]
MVQLTNIDLRLLLLFDEVYKTGNLSRAAEKLSLTQPAVSIALGRLRRHFDDPLFVRTSQGMAPTPYADGLISLVRAGIGTLQATIGFRLEFVPETSTRLFRICMTDVGQIVLLPGLLNSLRRQAPGVRMEVTSINEHTSRALEAGDTDLAVGFMPHIDDAFYQQVLFEEEFVCLARHGHPRVGKQLSLARYESELHVVVTTSGTGHLVVDQSIADQGVRRQVGVRIPNFLGLATVIGATDYLCTLPRRAGEIMAVASRVRVLAPPFHIPTYRVRQHWHERQARDPGHMWLRNVVADLYRKRR